MNRRLWWKLCLTLVVGMLVLFWAISQLALETEEAMSFIDEGHQQTLRSYAAQAEALHNAGDEQAALLARREFSAEPIRFHSLVWVCV